MIFYGGVGTCAVTAVQQRDFANECECLLLLQCCHLQNKQYKHYNDTEPRITDPQFEKIKSYIGKISIIYISCTALGLYLGSAWFETLSGHKATSLTGLMVFNSFSRQILRQYLKKTNI
jgi:hypothetical protein